LSYIAQSVEYMLQCVTWRWTLRS